MKHQAQPAYVEYFDRLEFPSLAVNTSSVSLRARRPNVILIWSPDCVDPKSKTPDGEGWVALAGHEKVADAMLEIASGDNPRLGETDINRWIEESKDADEEEYGWRRRWHAELSASPVIRQLLAKKDELYDRAGLTIPQVLAMRLVFGNPPMSMRQAGVQLGIDVSSVRDRLEGAKERLRNLKSDS